MGLPDGGGAAVSARIVAVGDDRRLARRFVEVPRRIYASDANWVPPLTSTAMAALDRSRNPFYRHADVEHFVLIDGEDAVGRIAATVYPAHNERYGTRTGFFGFFETPADQRCADLLLGAAEEWLRLRGMDRCAGPYNYCSTQEMGVLTDGFDEPPATFQTYNPPAYPSLLEARGYEEDFAMSTFRWNVADHLEHAQRIFDAGDAALEDSGLAARNVDPRHFDAELHMLRDLFNAAFVDNDDVLPYEEDVFQYLVRPLRRFIDKRLVTFLERDGEPVAFTVMVPNVNEILHRLDGTVGPLDLLRVRRYRKEVRTAVLLIIGSLPDVRGGVGSALISELGRGVLAAGYEAVHTTWIHDSNAISHALVSRFGAPPTKRFAVLSRELESAAPSRPDRPTDRR